MKKFNRHMLMLLGLALTALALPCASLAIDFDEVREFGDVFSISAQATAPDRIEVRWDISPNYYLYNNRFLEFRSETPGVELGEPEIPVGKMSFDELLGEEVIKFHDQLVVALPLVSVPPDAQSVDLRIRSQGCLEGVLCYPPTWQEVTVPLLAAAEEESVLDDLLGPPAAAPGFLDEGEALQPEAAFIYEAIGENEDTVLVRFTAQPGYYLYRDKLRFEALDHGFAVREVVLPDGVIKDDPEFGSVPVYYGTVEIPVRLDRPAGPQRPIRMRADFQGCRDGDICYPPMSREVTLTLPASVGDPASEDMSPAGSASEQDTLARLLLEKPAMALFAFFIAGLLLAFTPCVFPMLPILSGIIIGQGDRLTTLRAFWLSLVYVLAMAVTYTVAGVLAGLFGKNLQAMFQNPWIISSFVGIFVLLALSMFGFYELQLPSRWQTKITEVSNRQGGGNMSGVAVMGFLSALIVGPCVAPPLAAALIVIGSSGSAVLGGAALFTLSMGMGVPLIIFGVSAGKLLPRAGAWMDAIKAVFGVGLLALGIWMLERILPGGVIMALWGLLATTCGVYLGALERIPEGAGGWRKLWKSLGIILLVLGILELVGAVAGGDDWRRPLQGIRSVASPGSVTERPHFTRIKSLQDLENALAGAAAENKVTMLDFYADWCVECVRMERNTFPEPPVRELLDQMQTIQADVTPYDKIDQALMSEYGIIGPPAILFFAPDGSEMHRHRLVGYFEPEEFAAHLRRILESQ